MRMAISELLKFHALLAEKLVFFTGNSSPVKWQ
jgi:hypothetical protein